MTEAKTEPVCRWCGKTYTQHVYHARRWALCRTGGTLFFEPEPEAKEATDADFELRATCPHGFSYIEDCDRCPWSPEAKEVEQDTYGATMGRRYRLCWEDNARLRAELAVVTAERDEWRQAKGEEIEYSNRLELERDKMRPVLEAALTLRDAENNHTNARAWWDAKDVLWGRILTYRALDAAKPAEPKQPPVCCVWARDGQCHIHGTTFGRNVGVLGVFETHPRAVAHVAAEIASWDAEPTPLPAWALVDGKHRPHPDCRACDWPASRCGNPNCPALPITASEMHRAFHYVAMRWLQEQGATVT